METELIWRTLDAAGFEHVRVMPDHPEWTVYDSIFVRADGDGVRRGGYTLVIDKNWRTLELRLMLERVLGEMDALHLLTDGDGNWSDANGNAIAELQGARDVDIRWTPLTNSLPINRLALEPGVATDIEVVYIPLPTLTPRKISQTYRRLDAGVVEYASAEREFVRKIEVDPAGYVVTYPDLFSRTFPDT